MPKDTEKIFSSLYFIVRLNILLLLILPYILKMFSTVNKQWRQLFEYNIQQKKIIVTISVCCNNVLLDVIVITRLTRRRLLLGHKWQG